MKGSAKLAEKLREDRRIFWGHKDVAVALALKTKPEIELPGMAKYSSAHCPRTPNTLNTHPLRRLGLPKILINPMYVLSDWHL